MKKLIDKKILEYINQFSIINNYTPSYRDVAKALNISTSTAWNHINEMKKQGLIKDTGINKARALHTDNTKYLKELEEEYKNNPTDYNKGRLDEARKLLAPTK